MNAFLLYKDREFVGATRYFDAKSIVQDLGLKTLYMNAGKDVVFENGVAKQIKEQDPFISDTMSKVMAKAVDMQRELENSIAVLQGRRIETEKLIQSLGNSNEREVLRYYYLDTERGKPLTWTQVACKMSFDERWVRRLHNRAIGHLIEKGA